MGSPRSSSPPLLRRPRRSEPPSPVGALPLSSMNVFSFLHYQCLRLPPWTVALLILAGLILSSAVLCVAGRSAVVAILAGGAARLGRTLLGRLAGTR